MKASLARLGVGADALLPRALRRRRPPLLLQQQQQQHAYPHLRWASRGSASWRGGPESGVLEVQADEAKVDDISGAMVFGHGLGDRLQEPAEGAESSRSIWGDLAEQEASSVGGRDRVVLGGFSQGGAMALYTALQMNMMPLVAGVVCMSGYLPNQAAIAAALPPASRPLALAELPVLLCHGTADPMVSLDAAKRTRDALEELGLQRVELREYHGMAHAVCEEELDDVADWLRATLPKRMR